MRTIHIGKFIFGVCFLAGASGASANLMVNGSFENGAGGQQPLAGTAGGTSLKPNSASATLVTGWTALEQNYLTYQQAPYDVAWLTNGNFGLGAQQGGNFLDLTGYTDGPFYAGVQQIVTGLTAGTSYAMTFYIGQSVSNGIYSGPVSLYVTSTDAVALSYRSAADTLWTQATFTFTAGGSSETIAFFGASGKQFIGLDNVDLEAVESSPGPAAVPEPATLGLIGLGIAGVAVARRRKSI